MKKRKQIAALKAMVRRLRTERNDALKWARRLDEALTPGLAELGYWWIARELDRARELLREKS